MKFITKNIKKFAKSSVLIQQKGAADKSQHPLIFQTYFTAPVIPSANCFCSTKNTTIVGMEQNNTPHISIP